MDFQWLLHASPMSRPTLHFSFILQRTCLVQKLQKKKKRKSYSNILWAKEIYQNLSLFMTKPTKWSVRPVKTQISLGIRTVWSESSLPAWINIGPLTTIECTVKTLIRLGGCTVVLLVLSRGGSSEILHGLNGRDFLWVPGTAWHLCKLWGSHLAGKTPPSVIARRMSEIHRSHHILGLT